MSSRNFNWKKILSVISWSLAGGLLVFLLIAAETTQKTRRCNGVTVRIMSRDDARYIQEKDILNVISENRKESLQGRELSSFDLKKKEEILEKNLWIRNADLYFDHHDSLRVIIEQRVPVARVFCKDQSTFYLDDEGMRLPFSFNQIVSVPVFTSFPESSMKLNASDSLLLMQIRDVGLYLLKQPIWKAQIEQIDLNGNSMVIVPKVGNHEIIFGEGIMIEQKFKRLNIFYRQIINKIGWNYYSKIDLRFNKLLVGTRRDSASLFATSFIPRDTLATKFPDSIKMLNDSALLGITDSVKPKQVKKDTALKGNQIRKDTTAPKKNKPSEPGNKKKANDNKPKAVMTPVNRKDSTNKPNFHLYK
jgi:cell division protein FtsQ